MQALCARLALLLASAGLFRVSCAPTSIGQADSLSFMHISVLQVHGSKVSTGANHGGLMTLQVSSGALAKLHVPGEKSTKEQVEKGAKWKPPPPEPGFHRKLANASEKLQVECYNKAYATREDCALSIKMMESFIKFTDGPEPEMTWHGQIRTMMGLNYWLYLPGTATCFPKLDRDQSGNVTLEEMTKVFGVQAISQYKAMWKFLDTNSDGGFTREELHQYLRASILIREYLPQVDMIDPKADTRKCLRMARRVLNPPPGVKKLGSCPKFLSIAAIMICFCVIQHAIHRLFRARGASKDPPAGSPDGEEATPPSKEACGQP